MFLTNLVINARQALQGLAPPRRVEVTATATRAMLEIAVTDNGAGVPEALRSRIFDPFFTTKKASAGTGIGLAVSKGIVETHVGTLVLDTSLKSGARFVLRLPLAEAMETAIRLTSNAT